MKDELVQFLSGLSGISDVIVTSNDDDESESPVTSISGILNIGKIKGRFHYLSAGENNKKIHITQLSFTFLYTFKKKERKEDVLAAIDRFNQSKLGLKVTLDSFSKGTRFTADFSLECITFDLKQASIFIEPAINILLSAPIMFSHDLNERKMEHGNIVGK